MSVEEVERAMRGDHDAFAALIDASSNRLYALASLILRDTDRAQDATQEAIVRAWRELPRLRDPARFEAWLRRMVVNACYDEGRKLRRRAEVSLVHLADRQVVDPTTRLAETDRIERAFRRLPLEQRTTLVLQHQFGMTHGDIAETLGIPIGTVKSRIRYGTAAMREDGMTRERSDRDLDAALERWMDDVAPPAVPSRVLEEAFGRTMATDQVRVYPWERITRRSARPRHLTSLTLVATAALIVVALTFGVFGGGSKVGPGPTPTPTPAPTAASTPTPTAGLASPSAAAPVRIPIVPTGSVPLVGLQALATDGKVVWALTATGQVAPIDPETNTARAGTQLGGTSDQYQGIAADRNGVWVTEWTTHTLYRVDPATSKVVAKISVGLAPKGVLATGQSVWVADTHGGAVLRVDPATNKVVATIAVGPTGNSGPNWLASGLGSIWVGIPNASTVVRIDPLTNAIQATIAIPSNVPPCGGFAITDAVVWMTSCDGSPIMARIDPATNTVVATLEPGGLASTPAVIDGAPWVSVDTSPSVPGSIARVASTTNSVDRELSPGADFGGGGDLVVAAGSVWVVDGGHDRILRLPLSGFAPG